MHDTTHTSRGRFDIEPSRLQKRISIRGSQNKLENNNSSIGIGGTENIAQGNVANDTEADTGIIVGSDNNTIVNNEARENINGIWLRGDYNTVTRNDARDNARYAIRDEGEGNRLRANITE